MLNKKRTLALMLTLLGVLLLAAFPAPALAEEQMNMQDMYFSIWPEYDTPDTLVINTGSFVNSTGKDFQGEIVYNIPKDARVNMVCETEKGMVCQPYNDKTVEGDYRQVKWRPSRVIKAGEKFPVMFEYNYNNFQGGGSRDFTAFLKPTFDIKNLQVDVKAPLRSANFVLDPKPQSNKVEDGFTEYFYTYPELKAGQQLSYKITYDRPDNKPSVAKNEAGGSGQSTSGDQGTTKVSLSSTTAVLLAAFLLALVAFLIIALRRSGPQNRRVPAAYGGQIRPGNPGSSRVNQPRGKTTYPKGQPQPNPNPQPKTAASAAQEEKRKLRRMLLDGKISEDTYNQLVAEIDEEES